MVKFESLLGLGGDQSFITMPKFREWDVFINHRGKDVKETVASLLYHNLRNRNLNVFLDNRVIHHGHHIPLAICQAIRTSSVHIAIFSRHYAESTWCLRELCLMVESGASIIPIFCGVRPCDLRRRRGVYSTFLKKHMRKGRADSRTVNRWRDALIHVSYIYGFQFQGDYGILLENISNCVTNEIQARRQFQPMRLDLLVEMFGLGMETRFKFRGLDELRVCCIDSDCGHRGCVVSTRTVDRWRITLIQVSYIYGFQFQGDYGILLETFQAAQ